jgi:ubiquinone/menaquinone biosynthesis C-methylase UbiE
MTLSRVLEPEAMDTADDAVEYDAMDHSQVNQVFVDDLVEAGEVSGDLLDLGTGTARIPIELCKRVATCRVMAVDLAIHMLEIARANVDIASLLHRIALGHVDAKELPFEDGRFQLVMSNSILHHIPEPAAVLSEAVRVSAPQGRLFFRDLLRPHSEDELQRLVTLYAGDESEYARQMFAASLRAALTIDEMRDLVKLLGFASQSVAQTSDRHWTWSAAINL